MSRILLVLILVIAFPRNHLYSINLDDLIKKSLLQYPGYKIKEYDTIISNYNLKLSISPFYPQIEAGVSRRQYYDDLEGENASITLTTSYNIFSGFRDVLDLMISKIRLRLSDFIFEDYRRFIIKEVSNLYFDALRNKYILDSYKNIVDSSKKALDIARERFNVGRIRKIDLLQAEVNYSRSEYEYQIYIQTLKNILVNLSTYTGETYSIKDTFETAFIDVTVSDIVYYLQRGYEKNLNIVSKKYETEVAGKEINKSFSEFAPSVDLYLEEGRFYDELASSEYSTGATAGIALNWDIFTGFRRYYNVMVQKNKYYQSLMGEKLAKVELKEQVGNLHNNILSYNTQFYFLSDLLKFSEKNYDLTLESFILGKSDILELLDARDRFEEALIDYYTARFSIIRDYNELKYIAGIDE